MAICLWSQRPINDHTCPQMAKWHISRQIINEYVWSGILHNVPECPEHLLECVDMFRRVGKSHKMLGNAPEHLEMEQKCHWNGIMSRNVLEQQRVMRKCPNSQKSQLPPTNEIATAQNFHRNPHKMHQHRYQGADRNASMFVKLSTNKCQKKRKPASQPDSQPALQYSTT